MDGDPALADTPNARMARIQQLLLNKPSQALNPTQSPQQKAARRLGLGVPAGVLHNTVQAAQGKDPTTPRTPRDARQRQSYNGMQYSYVPNEVFERLKNLQHGAPPRDVSISSTVEQDITYAPHHVFDPHALPRRTHNPPAHAAPQVFDERVYMPSPQDADHQSRHHAYPVSVSPSIRAAQVGSLPSPTRLPAGVPQDTSGFLPHHLPTYSAVNPAQQSAAVRNAVLPPQPLGQPVLHTRTSVSPGIASTLDAVPRPPAALGAGAAQQGVGGSPGAGSGNVKPTVLLGLKLQNENLRGALQRAQAELVEYRAGAEMNERLAVERWCYQDREYIASQEQHYRDYITVERAVDEREHSWRGVVGKLKEEADAAARQHSKDRASWEMQNLALRADVDDLHAKLAVAQSPRPQSPPAPRYSPERPRSPGAPPTSPLRGKVSELREELLELRRRWHHDRSVHAQERTLWQQERSDLLEALRVSKELQDDLQTLHNTSAMSHPSDASRALPHTPTHPARGGYRGTTHTAGWLTPRAAGHGHPTTTSGGEVPLPPHTAAPHGDGATRYPVPAAGPASAYRAGEPPSRSSSTATAQPRPAPPVEPLASHTPPACGMPLGGGGGGVGAGADGDAYGWCFDETEIERRMKARDKKRQRIVTIAERENYLRRVELEKNEAHERELLEFQQDMDRKTVAARAAAAAEDVARLERLQKHRAANDLKAQQLVDAVVNTPQDPPSQHLQQLHQQMLLQHHPAYPHPGAYAIHAPVTAVRHTPPEDPLPAAAPAEAAAPPPVLLPDVHAELVPSSAATEPAAAPVVLPAAPLQQQQQQQQALLDLLSGRAPTTGTAVDVQALLGMLTAAMAAGASQPPQAPPAEPSEARAPAAPPPAAPNRSAGSFAAAAQHQHQHPTLPQGTRPGPAATAPVPPAGPPPAPPRDAAAAQGVQVPVLQASGGRGEAPPRGPAQASPASVPAGAGPADAGDPSIASLLQAQRELNRHQAMLNTLKQQQHSAPPAPPAPSEASTALSPSPDREFRELLGQQMDDILSLAHTATAAQAIAAATQHAPLYAVEAQAQAQAQAPPEQDLDESIL